MPNLERDGTNIMTQEEANSVLNGGTQGEGNPIIPVSDPAVPEIDYKKKFSDSSAEAIRLLHVQEEKDAEIERLREELELKGNAPNSFEATADNPFPGFEDLDDNAKEQFINYTNGIVSKATQQINKDPAIAYARKQFNTQKWEAALNNAISKYPKLAESKDEFRTKYFDVNNVPENIDNILVDVAKIHLFDSSMEIGAKEEAEKNNRIEIERNTSGPKETNVNRSLEDWQRMSKENPEQFRKLSKEFNADMVSGKI